MEKGKNMQDNNEFSPETLAIRAGIERSQFGEHGEALYLTSSFVQKSAEEAALRFADIEPGYTYSRFSNPTVSVFQDRLAALEGAQSAVAAASGMSAILGLVMGLLQMGDEVVASNALFGTTINLFKTILNKFGIVTHFVDPTNLSAWEAACTNKTRLLFVETPSNPLSDIADIQELARIAHRHGAWLAVDNSFCSPALQQPLKLGADLVVHSGTKYLDGQGRVLGGAVLGRKELVHPVFLFLRSAGPTLSAFNAWVLLKGLETLHLRMRAHSESALKLATWLETLPNIERVYHSFLPSHPQYELARKQQKGGGGVVSFVVKGGKEAAWKAIDATRMLSITANLGDTKTTITHPATTTHGRVSPEARQEAGVVDGLIRVAVGLEDINDIQADLARGLVK